MLNTIEREKGVKKGLRKWEAERTKDRGAAAASSYIAALMSSYMLHARPRVRYAPVMSDCQFGAKFD